MKIIRRPDKSRNDRFKVFNNENLGSVRTFNNAGVYETSDCRFESCRPRQKF